MCKHPLRVTEIPDGEITMICMNLLETLNFLRKEIAFRNPHIFLTVNVL